MANTALLLRAKQGCHCEEYVQQCETQLLTLVSEDRLSVYSTYFNSGKVISKSENISGKVTADIASSRLSSGKSTTPGLKAILILTKASVQSANKYLAFLE